jgi:hypothetical protein
MSSTLLESIQTALLESALRTAGHNERKAKAEADVAELTLEHVKRAVDSVALPAINVGGVKS